MRTKIKIFSSKISIPSPENNSIDEDWNLWTLAVEKENKTQKDLFTSREMFLLNCGNECRNSNDTDELKLSLVHLMEFRDIILCTKGWNKKELICSDNLGNELYLENFENKTYEDRLYQINSLIDTVEAKKNYLESLENKKSQLSVDSNLKTNNNTRNSQKFGDYLHSCDKEKMILKISNLLTEDTSAKNYVTIVFALESLGVLKIIDGNKSKFCDSLREQFNYSKSNQAFNQFYSTKNDISPSINRSDIENTVTFLYPFTL